MKHFATLLLGVALAATGAWLVFGRAPGTNDGSSQEPQTAWDPVGSRTSIGREVVEVDPSDARHADAIAANNRAVQHLREERLDDAIAELEPAHAAHPEHDVIRTNLAEAHARRATFEHDRAGGDREAALADLERAAELDPERADLASLLERWRKEADVEKEFTDYTSMHFELTFDGQRVEILHGSQEAIDVLEDAYADYRMFLDHDPVRERGGRLRVTLYEPEQFRELTGLGHWAGGAFDGTVRVPIEDFDRDAERWSRTLRHELFHAFLSSYAGRNVPGWLNEGLAQWHEVRGAALRQGLARAEERLGDAELFTLAELEGGLAALGDSETIGRAYAQSLLFTDYLLENYGEFVMMRTLGGVAEGQTAAQAFEHEVGVPLAEVLGHFEDLIRNP